MDNSHSSKDKTGEKSATARREESALAYWKENHIFEKSLERTRGGKEFVFYDGPPFATGEPHYGHFPSGTIKDIIPRFKTMQGYHVPRRWGWDCHGLPVENIVEKELGLKSKRDILTFGVDRFNEAARAAMMRFADAWREIIPRTGRWVDMENDYRTMDTGYTESVWWAFKTLHDKGLIYEGFKPMHLCPRCETTLSNFEVALNYKDIQDVAVTAKFELRDEPGTYLLAWTTTPWTLPGNVALAVNPDTTYSFVETGSGTFVIANQRMPHFLDGGDAKAKTSKEAKGKDLVGRSYKPLFDFYSKDTNLKNHANGWKVYGGDFVTTNDGTGIVHIAPAFGADDYELSLRENLPFVQHISTDGAFRREVKDFAGHNAKPIGNPIETDEKVVQHLESKGLVFKRETITHSYPFCWRCDTPLLNYASSSWFVKVTAIKDKLISENRRVRWIPDHMQKGRFGKWLEGAKDWAISRSRYWGAPIPVWRCEKCKDIKVVSRVGDLAQGSKSRNRYVVMRHGEAESNVHTVLSTKIDTVNPLTARGREQIAASVDKLRAFGIKKIIASPFGRTKETALLVARALKISEDEIEFLPELGEIQAGAFDAGPIDRYHAFFESSHEWLEKRPEGGESRADVFTRMSQCLTEVERKHEGGTILIVTHDTPARLLFASGSGLSTAEEIRDFHRDSLFIRNAEVKELAWLAAPRNAEGIIDLHRPYIDAVEFTCACGGMMRRIPDVFDCWFESGSMSYASHHFPHSTDDGFNPRAGLFHRRRGFPADFIAEGIDQTRGWFYTSLVLSVALFGVAPYRAVVVNGLVLAEDGRKMSKRLKNFPDVRYLLDRYGADAMRFYLMSQPVVRAEDMRFSERGVDEVHKKNIMRLLNVLSFYRLYSGDSSSTLHPTPPTLHPTHILDRWILLRLDETVRGVTSALNEYEIDRGTRPIEDFVDDLSTWYLRRSRERMKSDVETERVGAVSTTRHVLIEFAKLIAPYMPFAAEELYRALTGGESVHLEKWPESNQQLTTDGKQLLEDMKEVRRIVSLALEARAKEGMKVRQPLAKLNIKNQKSKLAEELLALIKDEVNVKEVRYDSTLADEVEIDSTLTPELKEEGDLREAIRTIQELRKEKGLKPGEPTTLATSKSVSSSGLLQKFESEVRKTASLSSIEHGFATAEDFELT